MNMFFAKVCQLGMALGWENISLQQEPHEHQIDSHWWFALNPHNRVCILDRGRRRVAVLPYCAYVECDGKPAGMISPAGGVIEARRKTDDFVRAIDQALGQMSRGQA